MKVKELIDYINSNDFYSLWDMENALCSDFLNYLFYLKVLLPYLVE